ncbi:hypothetical protein BDV19DRAFT_357496 [Aspergillus venezuelensis]
MESPLKKRRLSLSPTPDESYETSDVDIHEARAQNDLRLKSIFEGIFEKYGRDFTDIGDEIDLQTGDITVNNGHVHALDGEDHAGPIDWLEDPDAQDAQGAANEDADTGGSDEEEDGAGAREGQDMVSDGDREVNQNGGYPGRRRVVSILSQMRPNPRRSQEDQSMDAQQQQRQQGDSRDAGEDGDGNGNAEGDSDSTTSEADYLDDRSSVDSLLDTALPVQGPQGTRTRTHKHKHKHTRSTGTDTPRQVRRDETVTEKANPHSSQSQLSGNQRLDETVDPIWHVPEISAKFTTPSSTSLLLRGSRTDPKKKHIVSDSNSGNSAVRARSPPGSGSIWALPWTKTTRRRNNSAEGGAERQRATGSTTKKKQKDSPMKKRKKYHSSPPPAVICDWSFADTPDGSESDDPLQEDYEPSPSPTKGKGAVYIREKRKGPFSAGGSKSTTATTGTPATTTATTTTTTTTNCSYCKGTFSSKDGYVTHVRAVLADPADNDHDTEVLKSQLATATATATTTTTTSNNTTTEPSTDHSATGSISNATTSSNEPIVASTDTPKQPLDSQGPDTANESTPSGSSKRARTILGPEEARLIIRMKQRQGMKWKEILTHLPDKKQPNIMAWHHVHWSQRRANPPSSSGPWSDAELEKLESLKDQPGLTWPGIRAELPGRLLAEIEFKLLQLWAEDGS